MRTFDLALVMILAVQFALWMVCRRRLKRQFSSRAERMTFETLHTANLAAPPLRSGLSASSATRSARHLRVLLDTPALALIDENGLLAWDGPGERHAAELTTVARHCFNNARPALVDPKELACRDPRCPIKGAVIVPLVVEHEVVGILIGAISRKPWPTLVCTAMEVAKWIASQLELAELDASRDRLARAEIRALRAQISPHFIYNALTAIASFVRTDPSHARELLLEFAEFTRYSFRAHGDFTTLAEELRSIDRYLLLERARFGKRLDVRLQIAPEVLPVAVPFFALQPLVENAIRHGLSKKTGIGTVSIVANDNGTECLISVEDNGVGMDPEILKKNAKEGAHIGLGNVDDRLRSVFGDDFGLVVETAPGAGTKVSMRIPKFRAGVQAS